MLIADTRANRKLAGAVNARVSADAALLTARAWAIRCGALAVLCMGVGLGVGGGVGLAFWGYARVHDNGIAAERLAATLTGALEKAHLHAALDDGASVKLEPGAQVAIDPAANRVQVDGAVPRPTRDQLKPDAASGTGRAVQTNYTVFKVVRYGAGRVVTGYTFAPDGKVPDSQYCYYADGIDQQTFKTVHVAADGRYRAPPNPPDGLDPEKAAAECVWFDGRPTRF